MCLLASVKMPSEVTLAEMTDGHGNTRCIIVWMVKGLISSMQSGAGRALGQPFLSIREAPAPALPQKVNDGKEEPSEEER